MESGSRTRLKVPYKTLSTLMTRHATVTLIERFLIFPARLRPIRSHSNLVPLKSITKSQRHHLMSPKLVHLLPSNDT